MLSFCLFYFLPKVIADNVVHFISNQVFFQYSLIDIPDSEDPEEKQVENSQNNRIIQVIGHVFTHLTSQHLIKNSLLAKKLLKLINLHINLF